MLPAGEANRDQTAPSAGTAQTTSYEVEVLVNIGLKRWSFFKETRSAKEAIASAESWNHSMRRFGSRYRAVKRTRKVLWDEPPTPDPTKPKSTPEVKKKS